MINVGKYSIHGSYWRGWYVPDEFSVNVNVWFANFTPSPRKSHIEPESHTFLKGKIIFQTFRPWVPAVSFGESSNLYLLQFLVPCWNSWRCWSIRGPNGPELWCFFCDLLYRFKGSTLFLVGIFLGFTMFQAGLKGEKNWSWASWRSMLFASKKLAVPSPKLTPGTPFVSFFWGTTLPLQPATTVDVRIPAPPGMYKTL